MVTLSPSALGVRALLLTDIVDSTALAESLGEAACAAWWQAHDHAARELIRRWRGREIDKSDGLLVLFDAANDAVDFALAYHRALSGLAEAPKARAGIHFGAVSLRENGAADVALGAKPIEVDGVAKAVAARVMGVALGGQTLVTAAARHALADAGLRLESHGHWRFKGIAEPVELFEAAAAAAPFVAPPDGAKAHRVVRDGEGWLPLAQRPNNLPRDATSFIGRERELAELRALVDTTRLLTLVGMGGIGKTRLMLRAAREAMPEFPDGVWLAELAPLTEGGRVVEAVARALGVKEAPGRTLEAALVDHVENRRVLLLLDNCEHVVDACAALTDLLLRASAGVKLIASSREPLRAAGEQIYAVPALGLPETVANATPASLREAEAVRLFADRARAARADFAISDDRAPLVAEICRRVDGIALAIELAAARHRTMTLAEIAGRLDARMRLLTGGARAAQARQQTLRAAIDWSHELLDAREQALLRRLAGFVGGWWLDAAQAVCADEGIDADDLPDLLASLVDKSLVLAEPVGEATRFRLLETMREYALERLATSADDAWVRDRHQAHLLKLAEAVQEQFYGTETAAWMARIVPERDNLLAALAWSGGAAAAERELRLAAAMGNFGGALGVLRQSYEATLRILGRPACDVRTHWRSKALWAAARQAMEAGREADAQAHAEAALAIAREISNPFDINAALMSLGYCALQRGDHALAREGFDEALAVARDTASERLIAVALGGLAAVLESAADFDAAIGHYEENLRIWQRLDQRFNQALAHCSLARVHAAAGRLDDARPGSRAAIALARGIGSPRHLVAHVVRSVAHLAALRGEAQPALQLFGALAVLLPAADFTPLALDEAEREALARCRVAIGDEAAHAADHEGRRLGWDDLLDAADAALARAG